MTDSQQPRASSGQSAADALLAIAQVAAKELGLVCGPDLSLDTSEAEVPADEDLALDLLAELFDSYENGTQCYEEPDDMTGYLGRAVHLDNKTFHACADLLNRRRPVQPLPPAPTKQEQQQ